VAKPLYSAEQRARRDQSRWTAVQGILAPVQVLVMLVSTVLVLDYLADGTGYAVANASVVLKTLILYVMMITGSLWEHDVFGRYLFAESFFWEDVVSMVVIALHTAYLVASIGGLLDTRAMMVLALVAYGTYVINAIQFVWKLRQARLSAPTLEAAG
jgi:3-vinyl bacteriochlorophyllide hydratase